MRTLVGLVCISVATAQDEGSVCRHRVRNSVRLLEAASKQKDSLLFERRVVRRELEADGSVRNQTVHTLRRDPWEEQIVTRVIAKDDKPLSTDEIRKQEERLRKSVLDNRRNPPKPKDDDAWLQELPDALEFRRLGAEERAGRPAEVYSFAPRPGYHASHPRAKAFEKVRGRLWLDQADGEIVKLDAEVIDTIQIGFGVLGRIEKGTHFELERKKWDIGVWFEEWQRVRFDVRVMLVKTLRQEIESRWSNLSQRPSVKTAALSHNPM